MAGVVDHSDIGIGGLDRELADCTAHLGAAEIIAPVHHVEAGFLEDVAGLDAFAAVLVSRGLAGGYEQVGPHALSMYANGSTSSYACSFMANYWEGLHYSSQVPAWWNTDAAVRGRLVYIQDHSVVEAR